MMGPKVVPGGMSPAEMLLAVTPAGTTVNVAVWSVESWLTQETVLLTPMTTVNVDGVKSRAWLRFTPFGMMILTVAAAAAVLLMGFASLPSGEPATNLGCKFGRASSAATRRGATVTAINMSARRRLSGRALYSKLSPSAPMMQTRSR